MQQYSLNRLLLWGALFLVFGLSALSVSAQPAQPAQKPAQKPDIVLPKGMERVTSVEGITEYKLENGLRVLLFPDQSKPTITVNITYLVGSKHENYGESGMAHLLEHLVFKGTPKHKNVPQELTEHGARPNGTTWLDRTNYFETFSATDVNLEWALDLEADRMVNSFIAKKDLESEMTVVRNEFESGENNPDRILQERVMSSAYIWHNYGNTTIGARSDIENVPIDRLQAFYKMYYQPDNAILLVAGKFDEQKTISLINKYFAPTPRPKRELQKIYTTEPTQDGERIVTLRRVGDVQLAAMAYHICSGSHPDFAPIEVLSTSIGDSPSGRLYKALVETKKASAVGGFEFQLREPGIIYFQADVRRELSLDSARDIFLKTIDLIVPKPGDAGQVSPVTKEEVERAKTKLLKNVELTLNNSDRVGLQLSEWMAMGDWRLFFLHRDRIKKVTVEDVNRVAGLYLKSSNRTIGLFIPTEKPERAEIPPTPDVAAMLKDYKGDESLAAAEAFDPTPANIEARTVRSEASGVKTALLAKKTRGGSIAARMTLRFGDEQSLMNRGKAAEFAASMLNKGTQKHTRQQFQDELDKLKSRVNISGAAGSVTISIETVRESLPATLRLLAEMLRESTFPQNEFDNLKQEQLAGIESQKSEPQPLAATAFRRHIAQYPKGDVRYVATLDEEIASIKALGFDEVKKFYNDFYGASNAEFAAVGDLDDKEIQGLITTLFGSWKSPKPFARVVTTQKDVAAANQSINTPDKANAFFIAGLTLPVNDSDPDYPALVLGNYMMGGGFLNSRLAVRIRQKEGLSYGVGSQLNAGSLDKFGQFIAFAIYAPQNVAKLETAFKEEIAKMLKDGFTAEEVSAAKSGYLQSRVVTRSQDPALAGSLANYLFIKRKLTWDADFEKKIADLTPESISVGMRKYIVPEKITIFKGGDFAKAEAKPADGKPADAKPAEKK